MPLRSDDIAARRLAGLDRTPGGWVPTQPRLTPPEAAAETPLSQPGRADDGAPHPTVLDRGRDWLLAMSPTALAALAALCAVVLTVTAMTLLRPRSPGSGEPTATAAAATSFPPLPSPSAALIVVDVGGRVRHPGLVRLPPGSRVADAVKAAGGALRRTDLVTVDLAALVTDGELLLIGLPGGSPGAGPGAVAAGGKVDLNSATVDQLDALPGIGPVLAARIVAWRAQHGGFHSVDQLQDVPGIGPSIYAELQPLVTA